MGWCEEVITGRWAAKASHKINIKKKVAMREVIAPIDETVFHLVNASG